jgi:hypothetical protein
MRRRTALLLSVVVTCAFFPCAVLAHRLDEYLQATRIAVERDAVRLEINLTPGAAVAEDILATIDKDRNGEISQSESQAYGEGVLRSVSLSVDGKSYAIHLNSEEVPPMEDMRRGEGILRLYASAVVPSLASGRHQLEFSNSHRADISVYLVNALVPADRRIRINGQTRDMLQREFKMDYTVAEGESRMGLGAVWPPAVGLTLAATFLVLVRRIRERPSAGAVSQQEKFGKQ